MSVLLMLIISGFIAYGFLLYSAFNSQAYVEAGLIIFLIGLSIYFLVKVARFISVMRQLISALNKADFDIEVPYKPNDIFGRVSAMFVSALANAGRFEELRRNRVLMYYRALSVIMRRIEAPVLWVDVEKDAFKLNPAAQAMFGIEQDEYKLSGILNLPENEVFAMWLKKVIESSDIVPMEMSCEISLPVAKANRMVYIDAVSIKNEESGVQFVFLFLKQS